MSGAPASGSFARSSSARRRCISTRGRRDAQPGEHPIELGGIDLLLAESHSEAEPLEDALDQKQVSVENIADVGIRAAASVLDQPEPATHALGGDLDFVAKRELSQLREVDVDRSLRGKSERDLERIEDPLEPIPGGDEPTPTREHALLELIDRDRIRSVLDAGPCLGPPLLVGAHEREVVLGLDLDASVGPQDVVVLRREVQKERAAESRIVARRVNETALGQDQRLEPDVALEEALVESEEELGGGVGRPAVGAIEGQDDVVGEAREEGPAGGQHLLERQGGVDLRALDGPPVVPGVRVVGVGAVACRSKPRRVVESLERDRQSRDVELLLLTLVLAAVREAEMDDLSKVQLPRRVQDLGRWVLTVQHPVLMAHTLELHHAHEAPSGNLVPVVLRHGLHREPQRLALRFGARRIGGVLRRLGALGPGLHAGVIRGRRLRQALRGPEEIVHLFRKPVAVEEGSRVRQERIDRIRRVVKPRVDRRLEREAAGDLPRSSGGGRLEERVGLAVGVVAVVSACAAVDEKAESEKRDLRRRRAGTGSSVHEHNAGL